MLVCNQSRSTEGCLKFKVRKHDKLRWKCFVIRDSQIIKCFVKTYSLNKCCGNTLMHLSQTASLVDFKTLCRLLMRLSSHWFAVEVFVTWLNLCVICPLTDFYCESGPSLVTLYPSLTSIAGVYIVIIHRLFTLRQNNPVPNVPYGNIWFGDCCDLYLMQAGDAHSPRASGLTSEYIFMSVR